MGNSTNRFDVYGKSSVRPSGFEVSLAYKRKENAELAVAVLSGSIARVKAAINNNGDVNAQECRSERNTPFNFVAYQESAEMVDLLVQMGANLYDVINRNAPVARGVINPLIASILWGNKTVAKALLRHMPNLKTQPLWEAMDASLQKKVDELLEEMSENPAIGQQRMLYRMKVDLIKKLYRAGMIVIFTAPCITILSGDLLSVYIKNTILFCYLLGIIVWVKLSNKFDRMLGNKDGDYSLNRSDLADVKEHYRANGMGKTLTQLRKAERYENPERYRDVYWYQFQEATVVA